MAAAATGAAKTATALKEDDRVASEALFNAIVSLLHLVLCSTGHKLMRAAGISASVQAEAEAAKRAAASTAADAVDDAALISQLAETARQEAMRTINERLEMLMGALMLEAKNQLPGTATAYWSLVSAATADDAKEIVSAGLRLGDKMGLRDAASLIGVATGQKSFMEDVRSLAVAASCNPRIAYGLVGLATGSTEFLVAGASAICSAFSVPNEEHFVSMVRIIRTQLSDLGAFVPVATSLEVSPDLLAGIMSSASGPRFARYVAANSNFVSSVGLSTDLVPTAATLARLAHGDVEVAADLLKDDPACADVMRAIELTQATDIHSFTRLLQELTANPAFPRIVPLMDCWGSVLLPVPTAAHIMSALLSGSFAGASSISLMIDIAAKLSVPVHHLLAVLVDVILQHVETREAKEVGKTSKYSESSSTMQAALHVGGGRDQVLLNASSGAHLVALLSEKVRHDDNCNTRMLHGVMADAEPIQYARLHARYLSKKLASARPTAGKKVKASQAVEEVASTPVSEVNPLALPLDRDGHAKAFLASQIGVRDCLAVQRSLDTITPGMKYIMSEVDPSEEKGVDPGDDVTYASGPVVRWPVSKDLVAMKAGDVTTSPAEVHKVYREDVVPPVITGEQLPATTIGDIHSDPALHATAPSLTEMLGDSELCGGTREQQINTLTAWLSSLQAALAADDVESSTGGGMAADRSKKGSKAPEQGLTDQHVDVLWRMAASAAEEFAKDPLKTVLGPEDAEVSGGQDFSSYSLQGEGERPVRKSLRGKYPWLHVGHKSPPPSMFVHGNGSKMQVWSYHAPVSSLLALLKVVMGHPLRKAELPWVFTQRSAAFPGSKGPVLDALRRYSITYVAAPYNASAPISPAEATVRVACKEISTGTSDPVLLPTLPGGDRGKGLLTSLAAMLDFSAMSSRLRREIMGMARKAAAKAGTRVLEAGREKLADLQERGAAQREEMLQKAEGARAAATAKLGEVAGQAAELKDKALQHASAAQAKAADAQAGLQRAMGEAEHHVASAAHELQSAAGQAAGSLFPEDLNLEALAHKVKDAKPALWDSTEHVVAGLVSAAGHLKQATSALRQRMEAGAVKLRSTVQRLKDQLVQELDSVRKTVDPVQMGANRLRQREMLLLSNVFRRSTMRSAVLRRELLKRVARLRDDFETTLKVEAEEAKAAMAAAASSAQEQGAQAGSRARLALAGATGGAAVAAALAAGGASPAVADDGSSPLPAQGQPKDVLQPQRPRPGKLKQLTPRSQALAQGEADVAAFDKSALGKLAAITPAVQAGEASTAIVAAATSIPQAKEALRLLESGTTEELEAWGKEQGILDAAGSLRDAFVSTMGRSMTAVKARVLSAKEAADAVERKVEQSLLATESHLLDEDDGLLAQAEKAKSAVSKKVDSATTRLQKRLARNGAAAQSVLKELWGGGRVFGRLMTVKMAKSVMQSAMDLAQAQLVAKLGPAAGVASKNAQAAASAAASGAAAATAKYLEPEVLQQAMRTLQDMALKLKLSLSQARALADTALITLEKEESKVRDLVEKAGKEAGEKGKEHVEAAMRRFVVSESEAEAWLKMWEDMMFQQANSFGEDTSDEDSSSDEEEFLQSVLPGTFKDEALKSMASEFDTLVDDVKVSVEDLLPASRLSKGGRPPKDGLRDAEIRSSVIADELRTWNESGRIPHALVMSLLTNMVADDAVSTSAPDLDKLWALTVMNKPMSFVAFDRDADIGTALIPDKRVFPALRAVHVLAHITSVHHARAIPGLSELLLPLTMALRVPPESFMTLAMMIWGDVAAVDSAARSFLQLPSNTARLFMGASLPSSANSFKQLKDPKDIRKRQLLMGAVRGRRRDLYKLGLLIFTGNPDSTSPTTDLVSAGAAAQAQAAAKPKAVPTGGAASGGPSARLKRQASKRQASKQKPARTPHAAAGAASDHIDDTDDVGNPGSVTDAREGSGRGKKAGASSKVAPEHATQLPSSPPGAEPDESSSTRKLQAEPARGSTAKKQETQAGPAAQAGNAGTRAKRPIQDHLYGLHDDSAARIVSELLKGKHVRSPALFVQECNFLRRNYETLDVFQHSTAMERVMNPSYRQAQVRLFTLDTFLRLWAMLAGDGGDLGDIDYVDTALHDAVSGFAPVQSGDPTAALMSSPVCRELASAASGGGVGSSAAGRTTGVRRTTSSAFVNRDLPDMLQRLSLAALSPALQGMIHLRDGRVGAGIDELTSIICSVRDHVKDRSAAAAGALGVGTNLIVSSVGSPPTDRLHGRMLVYFALSVMHAACGRTLSMHRRNMFEGLASPAVVSAFSMRSTVRRWGNLASIEELERVESLPASERFKLVERMLQREVGPLDKFLDSQVEELREKFPDSYDDAKQSYDLETEEGRADMAMHALREVRGPVTDDDIQYMLRLQHTARSEATYMQRVLSLSVFQMAQMTSAANAHGKAPGSEGKLSAAERWAQLRESVTLSKAIASLKASEKSSKDRARGGGGAAKSDLGDAVGAAVGDGSGTGASSEKSMKSRAIVAAAYRLARQDLAVSRMACRTYVPPAFVATAPFTLSAAGAPLPALQSLWCSPPSLSSAQAITQSVEEDAFMSKEGQFSWHSEAKEPIVPEPTPELARLPKTQRKAAGAGGKVLRTAPTDTAATDAVRSAPSGRFGKAEAETEDEIAAEIKRHAAATAFLDAAEEAGFARTERQQREAQEAAGLGSAAAAPSPTRVRGRRVAAGLQANAQDMQVRMSAREAMARMFVPSFILPRARRAERSLTRWSPVHGYLLPKAVVQYLLRPVLAEGMAREIGQAYDSETIRASVEKVESRVQYAVSEFGQRISCVVAQFPMHRASHLMGTLALEQVVVGINQLCIDSPNASEGLSRTKSSIKYLAYLVTTMLKHSFRPSLPFIQSGSAGVEDDTSGAAGTAAAVTARPAAVQGSSEGAMLQVLTPGADTVVSMNGTFSVEVEDRAEQGLSWIAMPQLRVSRGKHYFEVEVSGVKDVEGYGKMVAIGFMDDSRKLEPVDYNEHLGGVQGEWAIAPLRGEIRGGTYSWHPASRVAYITSHPDAQYKTEGKQYFKDSFTLCLAVDMDSRSIFFRLDGDVWTQLDTPEMVLAFNHVVYFGGLTPVMSIGSAKVQVRAFAPDAAAMPSEERCKFLRPSDDFSFIGDVLKPPERQVGEQSRPTCVLPMSVRYGLSFWCSGEGTEVVEDGFTVRTSAAALKAYEADDANEQQFQTWNPADMWRIGNGKDYWDVVDRKMAVTRNFGMKLFGMACGATSGKWYYEVNIQKYAESTLYEGNPIRIGWYQPDRSKPNPFTPDTSCNTLGYVDRSWALVIPDPGNSRLKFESGDDQSTHAKSFMSDDQDDPKRAIQAGDTVCVAIDIGAQIMMFGKNGSYTGGWGVATCNFATGIPRDADHNEFMGTSAPMCPAVCIATASGGVSLALGFGSGLGAPLKFAPPPGFRPYAESLVSSVPPVPLSKADILRSTEGGSEGAAIGRRQVYFRHPTDVVESQLAVPEPLPAVVSCLPDDKPMPTICAGTALLHHGVTVAKPPTAHRAVKRADGAGAGKTARTGHGMRSMRASTSRSVQSRHSVASELEPVEVAEGAASDLDMSSSNDDEEGGFALYDDHESVQPQQVSTVGAAAGAKDFSHIRYEDGEEEVGDYSDLKYMLDTVDVGGAGGRFAVGAHMAAAMTRGKWYWEVTLHDLPQDCSLGIGIAKYEFVQAMSAGHAEGEGLKRAWNNNVWLVSEESAKHVSIAPDGIQLCKGFNVSCFSSGSRIGILLDMNERQMFITVDGWTTSKCMAFGKEALHEADLAVVPFIQGRTTSTEQTLHVQFSFGAGVCPTPLAHFKDEDSHLGAAVGGEMSAATSPAGLGFRPYGRRLRQVFGAINTRFNRGLLLLYYGNARVSEDCDVRWVPLKVSDSGGVQTSAQQAVVVMRDALVSRGRHYFELEYCRQPGCDASSLQELSIGWADVAFQGNSDEAGVGHDAHSWGWLPFEAGTRHGFLYQHDRFGTLDRDFEDARGGDEGAMPSKSLVFGCAVDVDARIMMCTVRGDWSSRAFVAFQHFDFVEGLMPAFSCRTSTTPVPHRFVFRLGPPLTAAEDLLSGPPGFSPIAEEVDLPPSSTAMQQVLSARPGRPSATGAGHGGGAAASGRDSFSSSELSLDLDGMGAGGEEMPADCMRLAPSAGWADEEFVARCANGCGTGDDGHSWGADGGRSLLWHNGRKSWGVRWNDGDTLCCLLDATNRKMWFAVNGEYTDKSLAFQGDEMDFSGSLYPVFTASSYSDALMHMRVRQEDFAFAPDFGAGKYVPVEEVEAPERLQALSEAIDFNTAMFDIHGIATSRADDEHCGGSIVPHLI
ncbi:RSPRY1, partial [Symbiodinium sp. KB8]